MHRILAAVVHAIRSLLRSRVGLSIENAALRHQLAVLKQRRPRRRLRGSDRLFWVLLRNVWSGWADALIVVKPETVIRWHRAGFRAYWRWKSRRKGRPRSHREIRDLIRRMATENRWGAPRIHAELLTHVVVFNEAHLRRLLVDYVAYYNRDRCHLALDKDAPEPREVKLRPTASAEVVALPRVGGIHHRYEWSDPPRIAA